VAEATGLVEAALTSYTALWFTATVLPMAHTRARTTTDMAIEVGAVPIQMGEVVDAATCMAHPLPMQESKSTATCRRLPASTNHEEGDAVVDAAEEDVEDVEEATEGLLVTQPRARCLVFGFISLDGPCTLFTCYDIC
jgi:hypothetical protein